MNGLNRNCVWLAVDKPPRRARLRDIISGLLLAGLFLAMLAWV